MRQKDMQRLVEHQNHHYDSPQADPIRGITMGWVYVKFAAWAIPRLIEAGHLVVPPTKTVPKETES